MCDVATWIHKMADNGLAMTAHIGHLFTIISFQSLKGLANVNSDMG